MRLSAQALLPILLLTGMLTAGPASATEQFQNEAEAQQHCPDGVAWLNTSSGRIHHKGTKWYGHTLEGAYICETKRAQAPREKKTRNDTGQWTAIATIDAFNGGATLYAAPASIKRHANTAEITVLMDFKHVQQIAGMEFLSSELHKEYNCKDGQWRILSSSVFDRNMGKGRIIQSDSEPDDWKPISQESPAKTEWNKACTEAAR